MQRLLIVLAFAVLALVFVVVGCGSNIVNHDGKTSGDDDNDADADDDADDDSADDDDAGIDVLGYCEEVWSRFDDCGWWLEDAPGDAISLEDLISRCEAGDEIYGNPDLIMCMKGSGCDSLANCAKRWI